jgi:hypothetical protein
MTLSIKGFWHIYLINHWYSIVVDQLRIMLTSGLYDAADEINIGCIGDGQQVAYLQNMIVNQYPKLRIRTVSPDPAQFEFLTLGLIEQDKSQFIGFYFHTKAVTKPFDTVQNHWRAWLNESILNDWAHHHHCILIGFDVSSVNHCCPPLHPEHFSGNFWWFNRDYINKLPPLNSLNHTNRWQAEQWICRGKGRFYASQFKEPDRDTFVIKR